MSTGSLLLAIAFSFLTTTHPGVGYVPGLDCKLVRKFIDATGDVDMSNVFQNPQMETFFRANPQILCIAWRIVGYDREAVRIEIREFNISNRPSKQQRKTKACWKNLIYIRDTDSSLSDERPAVSTIAGPYCGLLNDRVYWWSNGNDVTIEYHLKSLDQAKQDRFKFRFSVLTPMHGCSYEAIRYLPPATINASVGEISSPFDRSVASHSRCYWAISAPPDKAFEIEFLKYTIDAAAPFFLTLNDIHEKSSTFLGPKCCDSSQMLTLNKRKGTEPTEELRCSCIQARPPKILSFSNEVHIYYESRRELTTLSQGFSLKWKHVDRPVMQTTPTTSSTTTPKPHPTTVQPPPPPIIDDSQTEYVYFDDIAGPEYDKEITSEPAAGERTVQKNFEPNSDVTPQMPPESTTWLSSKVPIIYIDKEQITREFGAATQKYQTSSKRTSGMNGKYGNNFDSTYRANSEFAAAGRTKDPTRSRACSHVEPHFVLFAPLLLVVARIV